MLKEINQGFYESLRLYPPTWASTTAYSAGDLVKAVTYASHSYLCTIAGTSASVEPTWSTSNGNTLSDSTVTWKVYDPKTYQMIAPQGSSVPYVVFGMITESPVGDFADFEAVESLTYYVNVFSDKSPADLATKADNVMDALDGASITASGFTSMKCVREFIGAPAWYRSAGAMEADEIDSNIHMTSLRYRIWMDKS